MTNEIVAFAQAQAKTAARRAAVPAALCAFLASSRREHERHRDVAMAVARMARKRIGLDTATRMAEGADFGDNCELAARELEPRKIDPIEELKQIVSEQGTGLSPRRPKAPATSIRRKSPERRS